MMHSMVGKIISLDSVHFQWTIDDFLSKAWRNTITLKSPTFRFSGAQYYLDLTLSGEDGPLGLSCYVTGNQPYEKTNVKLRMKTGYRGKIETRRGKTDRLHGKFTVNVWMTWSEFSQKRSDILNDGRLTVFCELEKTPVLQKKLPSKINVTVENQSTEGDSDAEETSTEEESGTDETSVSDLNDTELRSKTRIFRKLQDDFKNLLTTGEDSDVTIKVQGKEFPAHRSILRSRSPVFKSMFSHDKVEKHNGVVAMDDCDPVAFPVFLEYLYTGSKKHISNENVFSLYTASHRYRVEELEEECAGFMENTMTVGTFFDTITLGLLHDDEDLVYICKLFFCKNASEIRKTAKWKTFLRENSTVGNKLIKSFLKEKRKRHYC